MPYFILSQDFNDMSKVTLDDADPLTSELQEEMLE